MKSGEAWALTIGSVVMMIFGAVFFSDTWRNDTTRNKSPSSGARVTGGKPSKKPKITHYIIPGVLVVGGLAGTIFGAVEIHKNKESSGQ